MADLMISDELIERLQKLAEKEKQSVDETLKSLLDERETKQVKTRPDGKLPYPDWLPRTPDSPDYDPIEDFIGMFDDVTDLSQRLASMSSNEVLLAMDGMFDDDITDLSSITKEDVMEAYRKKYGNAD